MHQLPSYIESPSDFRGIFRTDFLARSLYAEGAGIARAFPGAVAVPVDSDDVSVMVRWARSTGHSLMARGSGSGMAGGAVGTGVVVDLSRMRVIGDIDVNRRRVVVETGALRGQVDAAARAYGLRFPVDPSSGAFCTIGGMIAANAAGARSLRFGATRAWVSGLHCIFDDGSAAWIRRDQPLPTGIPAVQRLADAIQQIRANANARSLRHDQVLKESSGFAVSAATSANGHLLDLLIGSEGTLALFTKAELCLCSVAGATATALVSFASLDHATSFAIEARALGASACELLDRTFLDVAATDGPTGISADTDAVLLIEVEGATSGEAHEALQHMAMRCRRNGALEIATADDPETEHRLWAIRHAASPILSRLAPRLRSMQFIEDGCVPPDRFPDYVRGVRTALANNDMPGVIFGHAGDAHAHVNPLVDVTTSGWRERVYGILQEVTALTARLGGTLAGEHGDGRLRAPLLKQVWNAEALAAFANVKYAADPAGIFNIGCKISTESDTDAESGTDSISSLWTGMLRHDPLATPVEPRARRILDGIERHRAWHEYRLADVPSDAP